MTSFEDYLREDIFKWSENNQRLAEKSFEKWLEEHHPDDWFKYEKEYRANESKS